MELLTPHPTTEPYAAPEVWFGGFGRSSSVYGYSSDVWSYGAVLFEVITLKLFAPGPHDTARPRSRETAAELAKAVWAEDARAASQGPGAQEARASSQGPGAQACCEDTPRATPGSRALSAEEVLAKLFP